MYFSLKITNLVRKEGKLYFDESTQNIPLNNLPVVEEGEFIQIIDLFDAECYADIEGNFYTNGIPRDASLETMIHISTTGEYLRIGHNNVGQKAFVINDDKELEDGRYYYRHPKEKQVSLPTREFRAEMERIHGGPITDLPYPRTGYDLVVDGTEFFFGYYREFFDKCFIYRERVTFPSTEPYICHPNIDVHPNVLDDDYLRIQETSVKHRIMHERNPEKFQELIQKNKERLRSTGLQSLNLGEKEGYASLRLVQEANAWVYTIPEYIKLFPKNILFNDDGKKYPVLMDASFSSDNNLQGRQEYLKNHIARMLPKGLLMTLPDDMDVMMENLKQMRFSGNAKKIVEIINDLYAMLCEERVILKKEMSPQIR